MRKLKNILFLLASVSGISLVSAQNPDWQVSSADYQFSMNITGVLVNTCIFSDNPGNRVAAFVGEELRGTSTFSTEYGGLALAFLTVFSNSATGETLTFKVYDSENDQVIDLAVQVSFTENDIKGDPARPFQFYVDAPILEGSLEQIGENTLQYSESIPGAVYTWYKDGELLGSGEENSLTVCSSGWYKVEVENGACSIVKDSLQFNGGDQKIAVNKDFTNSTLTYLISVSECEDSYSDYTFDLVDGDGAEDNHLFEIVGDTLQLKPGSGPQTKIDYKIRVKASASNGSSFEQIVDLEYIALGTRDALAQQIKVYPNPFNSANLNIELPGNLDNISSYKLLTSEGMELVTGTKLSGSSHTLKLPDNLKPGLYILEMEIKGQVLHKKLVKE